MSYPPRSQAGSIEERVHPKVLLEGSSPAFSWRSGALALTRSLERDYGAGGGEAWSSVCGDRAE